MSHANDRQVGGEHYRGAPLQHWDLTTMFGWDYFQAQIIKYVMRHKKKNGLQDLEKAAHFIEKYIEVEKRRLESEEVNIFVGDATKGYVDQD